MKKCRGVKGKGKNKQKNWFCNTLVLMFINLNIIKSYNKIIHCFCLQPDPSSMVPGPYPWLAMSQSMSSPISSSAPVSVHYWEWWWDIQPVDGLPTFHIWGDLIAGIDRWCFWSVTLTFISQRWTQKHWTNIGFINVSDILSLYLHFKVSAFLWLRDTKYRILNQQLML